MKFNRLIATTALAASLGLSGLSYAADPGSSDQPAHHGGWRHHMQDVISQLPSDKAQQFRDAMKKGREENKPLFEQSRKIEDEMDAILTADKFDKSAYLSKAKELQDVRNKMSASRSESFASVAATFSQDERKTLAKLHAHPMKHHGHGESTPAPASN